MIVGLLRLELRSVFVSETVLAAIVRVSSCVDGYDHGCNCKGDGDRVDKTVRM